MNGAKTSSSLIPVLWNCVVFTPVKNICSLVCHSKVRRYLKFNDTEGNVSQISKLKTVKYFENTGVGRQC